MSNAVADFNMAFAYLQGRGVARDLTLSREHFRKAADAGHLQAKHILIALLANGTTGGRDWQGALERLQELGLSGDAQAARQVELLSSMDVDAEGNPKQAFEGERLSERPAVTLFANFFSEAERRYLMDAALSAYQPATVGHVAGGHARQVVQQVRTCDVAGFPWIAEDPIIYALNRRIAAAAGVTVETGEPLQILRYRPGQEFKPHRDATEDRENQRVLTMLVYLNDNYTGGETLFLRNNLKVRGKAGDGLLFRNADANGVADPDSLHAGLPVESGAKVVASRWIRQKRFGPAA